MDNLRFSFSLAGGNGFVKSCFVIAYTMAINSWSTLLNALERIRMVQMGEVDTTQHTVRQPPQLGSKKKEQKLKTTYRREPMLFGVFFF